MQAETQTKMTILGRGSMRDKRKEEELRTGGDPMHAHLNDDLHILIEVAGQFSEFKLLAGIAEVRKMLVPAVSILEIFSNNVSLSLFSSLLHIFTEFKITAYS